MNFENVETKELVEELTHRAGVKRVDVAPYQDKEVSVNGPAIIFVVID